MLVMVSVTWASLFVVRWEPAPFDLLILVVLAWWLLRERFVLPMDSSLNGLLTGMFVMLVVQVLSFWNTPSVPISLRFTIATILVFAVALVSYLLALDRRGLEVMVASYVFGAVVSTSVFLLVIFGGLPQRQMLVRFGSRVTGLTKDPNVLAPYLIVSFVLLLAMPEWSGRPTAEPLWRKVVWTGALCVLALAVVFAYSRAGWVNLILAITVYWALRSLESKATAARVVAAVVVAVPVVLALLSRIRIPEDSLLAERIRPQAYDQERFATQAKSVEEFWESPFLGHGPGMTNDLLEVATHNSYLRVLYENGAISLLAFAFLLAGAVWLSFRASQNAESPFQRRIAAATCAALIGMLVSSFVIDSVHWRHLWMLIGIGWSSNRWVVPRDVDASRRPIQLPASAGGRGSLS
jgi:O-antigen ligase